MNHLTKWKAGKNIDSISFSASFLAGFLMSFLLITLLKMVIDINGGFAVVSIFALAILFKVTIGFYLVGSKYLRHIRKKYGPKTLEHVIGWINSDDGDEIDLVSVAQSYGELREENYVVY